MKGKAIVLLSGGLDSTLAVKMMLDQGLDIMAVNFMSPFCNCTPKSAGCQSQAKKVADKLGVPIRILHKGMDYMRMVEHPPHGYGRGMNPCVDCRIHMLRKVKELMPLLGASFVVTGEVLGQRPMSQRRNQIALIEKESGLEGLILRPLSAHHFSPTIPEVEGIVDRKKLLAISGRSRRVQMDLACDFGISDYPCPAGGCMLTDPDFALKLKDLFIYYPDYNLTDLHILRIGRHFRLSPRLRLILGRNEEENEKIATMAASGSTIFTPEDFRGPTAYVKEKGDENADKTVGSIIARYSKDEKEAYLVRKRVLGGAESVFTISEKFPAEKLVAFRLG